MAVNFPKLPQLLRQKDDAPRIPRAGSEWRLGPFYSRMGKNQAK